MLRSPTTSVFSGAPRVSGAAMGARNARAVIAALSDGRMAPAVFHPLNAGSSMHALEDPALYQETKALMGRSRLSTEIPAGGVVSHARSISPWQDWT